MTNRKNIITDIKNWKPIIVLDHRECEGDFFVAGEYVTPELINFFLTYGKWVLCVSMSWEVFERYGIDRPTNIDAIEQTHFGQVIDLSHTITTGISASDRSATIKALTNDAYSSTDFLSYEGHVRTLEAHPWWLRSRAGHTEAAVALCELAGCKPVGVIIEILDEAWEIADKVCLEKLAEDHGLQLVTVNELLEKVG